MRLALGSAARVVVGLLAVDEQLLPFSLARHWRSKPRSALEWGTTAVLLVLELLKWLLERLFLLFFGLVTYLTAIPQSLRVAVSSGVNRGGPTSAGVSFPPAKALARGGTFIASNAFKAAALFAGATLGTYHIEYLQPHGADAWAQFLHDSQRLAISPAGGFGDIPLPTPLPRALDEAPARRVVHHMTVATKFEENLYRLLRSAQWHGDSIDVLGRNDPRLQRWGAGFGVKVEMLLEYCDSLPPDDVVLFTDAYDVLMLGSHEDALEGYRRVLAQNPPGSDPTGAGRHADVVFTAEVNCAPDEERAGEYPAEDRQHLFAYLNSGLIMGSAGGLARLLREYPPMDFQDNDQRWFTSMYIDSTRNASMVRVVLDHTTQVFLTMTFRDVGTDLVYSPVERTFRHAVTGNVPSVIHYPGWVWRKQHVQTWHLLQGANNTHCALYMCLPMYAGYSLLAALAAGALLGAAWQRLLPLCKLGRALQGFAADRGW